MTEDVAELIAKLDVYSGSTDVAEAAPFQRGVEEMRARTLSALERLSVQEWSEEEKEKVAVRVSELVMDRIHSHFEWEAGEPDDKSWEELSVGVCNDAIEALSTLPRLSAQAEGGEPTSTHTVDAMWKAVEEQGVAPSLVSPQRSEPPQLLACLTPGCHYVTKTLPYYNPSSYGAARIDISVAFPKPRSLAAPSGYEGDEATRAGIWGERQKAFLDRIEQIIHPHLERAIAEVGQFDLSEGGDLAKDWPPLPTAITAADLAAAIEARLWADAGPDDAGETVGGSTHTLPASAPGGLPSAEEIARIINPAFDLVSEQQHVIAGKARALEKAKAILSLFTPSESADHD